MTRTDAPPYLRRAARIWQTFCPDLPFPISEAREIALTVGPAKLEDAIAQAARDGDLCLESLQSRLSPEAIAS